MAKITLTPELDETLRRIQDSKNVAGIILINKEGITVKSSLDSSVTALVSSTILGSLLTIEIGGISMLVYNHLLCTTYSANKL